MESKHNMPKITKHKTRLRDNSYGKNITIVEPSNIYEAILKDNVFVGPFCEIQKGVKIGKNTRVQSHTFICELVTIGKDCFIGHGVMFINDLFHDGKPSGRAELWKKTKIKNRVSIGSNATILPVKICNDVVIGAGSVVTKDIIESGIYTGNPAKKIRNL
jgi:acetyltransferase-like isoleucine patch superfamily enzyme